MSYHSHDFVARSALVVCAHKSDRVFVVCCLLFVVCWLVPKVIDFYHEHMEGRHMQWLSGTLKSGSGRFSKSYPPGEH